MERSLEIDDPSCGAAAAWRTAALAALEAAEPESPDAAERLLALAEAGVELRRPYDASAWPEALADLPALLARLQSAAVAALRTAAQDPAKRMPFEQQLERTLAEDRRYFEGFIRESAKDRSGTCARLERFGADLGFRDQVFHVLNGETPPHPAYRARAALDDVMQLVVKPVEVEHEPARAALYAEAAALRRKLLERRAANELATPTAHRSAGELWRERLTLTRLQADLVAGPYRGAPELAAQLEAQRERLADLAKERASANAEWPGVRHEFVEADVETRAVAESLEGRHRTTLMELALADALRLQRDAQAARGNSDGALRKELDDLLGHLRKRIGAARNRLQDAALEAKQIGLFGLRPFRLWENLLLVLVLCIVLLLFAELVAGRFGVVTPAMAAFFAYSDLAICSVFLADFALRISLVGDRLRYLRRHAIVDVLASTPFGYLAWVASSGAVHAAENLQFIRLLRLLRLQLLQPILRVFRIALFAVRFADGLMNRYARHFNHNIVLWEPEREDLDAERAAELLAYLRDLFERRQSEFVERLRSTERLTLAQIFLVDVGRMVEHLPAVAGRWHTAETHAVRETPVEEVVARLISMTPERLNQQMGPAFADSVSRYVRLFDLPLVRKLPVVRDLVTLRTRGPGEVAAAAANQTGRLLQWVVDVGHFGADLRGTVSPPVFVDRLGTALVAATQGPAKRLFTLFGIFLVVYLLSLLAPLPAFVDEFMARILKPLGGFLVILGGICTIPMLLGVWLKRIARQASELGTRIVEAQFLGQTKRLKQSRKEEDSKLLWERVVAPELALRSADDRTAGETGAATAVLDNLAAATAQYHPGEVGFLRTVDLLYLDFLDGSPFHRSDTKTANQIVGNLALVDLRQADLQFAKADRKVVATLDLNRSSGAFGGPNIWFNYINRMLEQETAKLLLDYNRHAQPLERLAVLPTAERTAYRAWLADRLNCSPDEVALPPPASALAEAPPLPDCPRRSTFEPLETVQFSALDFLVEDAERDRLLEAQFGAKVANLVRQDRREVVRKAFRSYPLHRLPRAQRTFNPYEMYQRYMAGGRALLLPLRLLYWTLKQAALAFPRAYRVVREVLRPGVSDDLAAEPDTFGAAMRKVYRMRRPMFLASLWLRARFDVEYLGLTLPGVPVATPAAALLERDLDFIGASHFDRLAAERLRLDHIQKLRLLARILQAVGLDFAALEKVCAEHFPHLVERRAEVVRALAVAAIVDFDDVRSLGSAALGLQAMFAYAADGRSDPNVLPADLPPPVPDGPRWRRCRLSLYDRLAGSRRLFAWPCFPRYDLWQQQRIRAYLRRHRRVAKGWIDVLLRQGAGDPFAILRQRLLDVVRRVDLWGDKIVTLRTVQTLTLLDVDHYCRLVWDVGKYAELGDAFPEANLLYRDANGAD